MAKVVNIDINEGNGEPGSGTVIATLDDGRTGENDHSDGGIFRQIFGPPISKEEAIQQAINNAYAKPVPDRK